jgi:hypothetical protein
VLDLTSAHLRQASHAAGEMLVLHHLDTFERLQLLNSVAGHGPVHVHQLFRSIKPDEIGKVTHGGMPVGGKLLVSGQASEPVSSLIMLHAGEVSHGRQELHAKWRTHEQPC